MTAYPNKGGVKGGHATAVETQINHVQRPHIYHMEDTYAEQWPKGLTNVGNSCYANAALQCLLSTALTNALLDPKVIPLFRRYSSNPNLLAKGSGSVDSDEDDIAESSNDSDPPKETDENEKLRRKEKEEKKMEETCQWLTRELTAITHEYTREIEPIRNTSYLGWLSPSPSPSSVVDPGSITRHPDRLSKCLHPYQQEDAHEFLRALLSTLVMNGHNKQLSSLFDGLLESAVTCQTCGRASLTRDRYMDLSLDINSPDITSLDDALFEYTKTEVLDADNAVFCPKCDKKRSVTKGLRLATAPSILVCHLKRFAFDQYGRLIRLHKKIKFEESLEIGDYMSNLNKARPPPYDLVGILVHQGHTCASGHYLAFVKKNDEWFKCNDSVVTKVDQATVFDQQAYIMMYEVAEMRERTGCTPRAKLGRQMPITFADDDDAEVSKDGTSMHACASIRSTDPSCSSTNTRQPYHKLLQQLLNETDGITRFFTDMCCDSSNTFKEPKTHELRRTGRRRNRDETTGDTGLRKTSSSEALVLIEARNANLGIRSQTAPRQRSQSYDYPVTAFDADSPRTTLSANDNLARERETILDLPRHSNKRPTAARMDRSRSIRELPPLPRQRRAQSNASARQKRSIMMV